VHLIDALQPLHREVDTCVNESTESVFRLL
jgi:hypothetical protein